MTDPERTALKEWAVLVDAMARGDIIAMVRKGGIREQRAGFSVRHDRFVLYPTFFHENPGHLADRFHSKLEDAHDRRPPAGRIVLKYAAEVLSVWNITDASLLPAVAHEHGLAPVAVDSRFHYRGKPNVRLVAVRTLALEAPVEIPDAPRYAGCVSWLELDVGIEMSNARAVLTDAALRPRLDRLRELLGEPERDLP